MYVHEQMVKYVVLQVFGRSQMFRHFVECSI